MWLLLPLVGLLAYANACTGPFVFDDETTIVPNQFIRNLWSGQVLGAPPQSALSGRPVVAVSFAVNYAIDGLNPWGYHAFNLGIHLLTGLLVFGIARQTLANPRLPETLVSAASVLALTISLIWLAHPLNSEVVGYVTQRTEAMMGLWFLLTLYASIRAFGSANPARWSSLAISACSLGMATKESMVTAPVLVLLYGSVLAAG